MSAVEFIKEHGIDKAREVLRKKPLMNAARYRPCDDRYSSAFNTGNTICTIKLKRLVESVDLVNAWGGVGSSRSKIKYAECQGNLYAANMIKQAITDYELIYEH